MLHLAQHSKCLWVWIDQLWKKKIRQVQVQRTTRWIWHRIILPYTKTRERRRALSSGYSTTHNLTSLLATRGKQQALCISIFTLYIWNLSHLEYHLGINLNIYRSCFPSSTARQLVMTVYTSDINHSLFSPHPLWLIFLLLVCYHSPHFNTVWLPLVQLPFCTLKWPNTTQGPRQKQFVTIFWNI